MRLQGEWRGGWTVGAGRLATQAKRLRHREISRILQIMFTNIPIGMGLWLASFAGWPWAG
jgi:hypothetical protein